MLVITGTVRIPGGAMEAVRPVVQELIEASRQEQGCLLYAFSLDVLDPTLIHITEQWESWDHLKAHAATEHYVRWRAAGKELGIYDRKVQVHTVSETKDI